jgi:predicted nuclease of predicted toxin-antitoxin system
VTFKFKFYANENLSADLVKALRHLGYDVLTSYEAGNANQGIPDDQVLQTATAKNRSVITFNRDDFLALHRSGVEHSGIVVCKDDSNTQGIGQALHDYLGTQETLQNRLLRVLQKNQPGLSHPIFIVGEYLRE